MGRPIKKTFFGNLNREKYGSVRQYTGVGGEGATSVGVSGSGTNYSVGATVTFSAPQIAGGLRATGTLSIPASGTNRGKVMAVTVTEAGSGYTSAPTFTFNTATSFTAVASTGSIGGFQITVNTTTLTGNVLGMKVLGSGAGTNSFVTQVTDTGTIVVSVANAGNIGPSTTLTFTDAGSGATASATLTTNRKDAIQFGSYLSTGSSAVHGGDIIKQEASRRYLVNNAQGQGQCKLVTTSTLAAGQMNIVATDWNGSTYYVKKLTAHKAVLVTSTATAGGFLLANNSVAGWNITAATGTTVTLANTN